MLIKKMSYKDAKSFLKALIEHQLFKILPMKEDDNPSLDSYLDSLIIEVWGAKSLYPELDESNEYLRIMHTLSYFKDNEYSVVQCKREVFKMINLAKKILERIDSSHE